MEKPTQKARHSTYIPVHTYWDQNGRTAEKGACPQKTRFEWKEGEITSLEELGAIATWKMSTSQTNTQTAIRNLVRGGQGKTRPPQEVDERVQEALGIAVRAYEGGRSVSEVMGMARDSLSSRPLVTASREYARRLVWFVTVCKFFLLGMIVGIISRAVWQYATLPSD